MLQQYRPKFTIRFQQPGDNASMPNFKCTVQHTLIIIDYNLLGGTQLDKGPGDDRASILGDSARPSWNGCFNRWGNRGGQVPATRVDDIDGCSIFFRCSWGRGGSSRPSRSWLMPILLSVSLPPTDGKCRGAWIAVSICRGWDANSGRSDGGTGPAGAIGAQVVARMRELGPSES